MRVSRKSGQGPPSRNVKHPLDSTTRAPDQAAGFLRSAIIETRVARTFSDWYSVSRLSALRQPDDLAHHAYGLPPQRRGQSDEIMLKRAHARGSAGRLWLAKAGATSGPSSSSRRGQPTPRTARRSRVVRGGSRIAALDFRDILAAEARALGNFVLRSPSCFSRLAKALADARVTTSLRFGMSSGSQPRPGESGPPRSWPHAP
jgi:hypothetical protein